MAYESATHDGMTVESSSETADQIRDVFAEPTVEKTETPKQAATVEDVVTPAETAEAAKKRNRRDDPQEAVKSAVAKQREAERRAADLEARLTALEKPKPEQAKQSVAATEDAEPTVDQFDSYEKFVKAQARWEARQEIRQQETERHQHAALQQREYQIREVDQKFGERYNAILADDPEFPTKVDPRLLTTPRAGVLPNPGEATFGNFLVEQVFQSEHVKELLLHLSDQAEVQRLATLPPAQVIRELAKFEARLDAASTRGPAPLAISTAKRPIQPLGTSHVTASDSEPADDAPIEQHIKYWNAAERKQKRG